MWTLLSTSGVISLGSSYGVMRHTLSVSATKNMLSSVVETSNAWGLFRMSSAPLMERHRLTCSVSSEIEIF